MIKSGGVHLALDRITRITPTRRVSRRRISATRSGADQPLMSVDGAW